jgi:hypothetical protein
MNGKLTVNLETMIDNIMSRHDSQIAEAEARLCLALCANGDTADEAIADLTGAVNTMWEEVTTLAYWTGYNAGSNGR